LAPELDDIKAGKVRNQLVAPQRPGHMGVLAGLLEQVIQDAGRDWDRRTHRIVVLAGAASPALAKSWLRNSPGTADALLFHAWVTLVHGGLEESPAESQSVADACYAAADLEPEDPLPWVTLLGLLRVLRRPSREVFSVWREITARDSWHREAHLQMLGYLSPDECGSHGQRLDFVDAARSAMPPGAPAASVELVSMIERHHRTVSAGGVTELLARRQWQQSPMSDALDRAFADWPTPGFLTHAAALADLNLLAYALVQSGRSQDAAEVFKAIGAPVSPWPWMLDGDPLEQYTYWHARVTR
jgi:hypothetical protein